jgi:predicted  nucleic acid-binding Zn-ribbon protein
MTQKSAYIEKMKSQLDDLNTNMNALQAKAAEAKADARDMYKSEMAKLQEQSQLAMTKLGEIKSASEESWDAMVAEMDKVRDAFVHSFHYFKSQV